MKSFFELENTIRDYAWGHSAYIPEFLGLPVENGKPAAELWMGAHSSAPSIIKYGSVDMGLDRFIEENGPECLGPEILARYSRLPFLFKLLAAGKSLSIQAHPDKAMAEEGFARENREGIPLDAVYRNYRDDNHKPEILMALTPFTAMIGFRNPKQIAENFSALENPASSLLSASLMDSLASGDSGALKPFLTTLLESRGDGRTALIRKAVKTSENNCIWEDLQCRWIPRLARQFPGDIGALAPLFLNVIEIEPGEALYQPARVLHAYLDGFGLELMANSDNVLRGGLTPKNIDVPELAAVLKFESFSPEILRGENNVRSLEWFDTPADEFILGTCELTASSEVSLSGHSGPCIVIALSGEFLLKDGDSESALSQGHSVFIPWSTGTISISGTGRFAVAGVPR